MSMLEKHCRIGSYVNLCDETYSYFAGNDYLGLASHPAVINAASQALYKYGVSFSASRSTTGTSEIHLELEQLLAQFKGHEDAVVFATGYLGNRMLLQALRKQFSIVFADSQAHPSTIESVPNGTELKLYEHCNIAHLEILLRKLNNHRALIITDGVFPLTGEIAPVDVLYSLANKYDALLVVDDAHATGILGNTGKGTPEYFNLDKAANIYQTETMSKALGAYGGFISADKNLIQNIRMNSSFYRASTALPPPLVAAGCATLRLIQEDIVLRKTLKENSDKIRKGIKELGFLTSSIDTPIIPIIFQDSKVTASLSEFLKVNKIIAPAVNYPVETGTSIVRITASSIHSEEQIDYLLSMLKKWTESECHYLFKQSPP